jgi:NhaA family Na+:H+ antiporter
VEAPVEDAIRPSWSRSERAVPRRVLRPLQSFLETEVASGVLLLGALAAALLWANLGSGESYERVWGTEVAVRLGSWTVSDELRGWIADGLMALFFLVVALEIKREFTTGELRSHRSAVLPVAAAVGGMLIPAVIYLLVTAGTEASSGWGVAMPTDIALALGVLALGMPRAPAGLRVFLLSLAIADDLGTIMVVALAYSHDVAIGSLALAAGVALLALGLERIHVRPAGVYVGLGVAMWLALHDSGVSPTLAGVVMGFLTPAVPFQRPRTVSAEAHRVADETSDDPSPPDADAGQWLALASLSREAVSPLARVESGLHPWTSFLVVPLFALSNAGVELSVAALSRPASVRTLAGIVLARVLGKPLGIATAAMLVVRLRAARLPAGVTWSHVVAVGAAAGVPLTVSLFIAELSLEPALHQAAEIGIVASALLAGVVGFGLLRRAGRRGAQP